MLLVNKKVAPRGPIVVDVRCEGLDGCLEGLAAQRSKVFLEVGRKARRCGRHG